MSIIVGLLVLGAVLGLFSSNTPFFAVPFVVSMAGSLALALLTTLALFVAPVAPRGAYLAIYEYRAFFFFGPAVLLAAILAIAIKLGIDVS